jgi:hypothetical protein
VVEPRDEPISYGWTRYRHDRHVPSCCALVCVASMCTADWRFQFFPILSSPFSHLSPKDAKTKIFAVVTTCMLASRNMKQSMSKVTLSSILVDGQLDRYCIKFEQDQAQLGSVHLTGSVRHSPSRASAKELTDLRLTIPKTDVAM